ncbi:type III secretion system needle length determinant [Aeromonas sp. sia0103]|uniref:type III secretion system needle length determinant n=1 Tax=Aeromonas sp. sia0103 TaxID=2854782 RepID=UPI0030D9A10E
MDSNPSVPDTTITTGKIAQPQGDTPRTDSGETTSLLAAESEETTQSREELVAVGQQLPPPARTPGDLLLARVSPAQSNPELGRLLERLAVDIHLELGRPDRPPLLRLNLPALGDLAIRIAHHGGELQIEIQASSQGQLLLNQGRSELFDRLQRLYPGELVRLDLFSQGDSEQGSRQQRSIYEEWDADA